MLYAREIPVEFNHCDPAGIVFYPRYFEMTNSVVENFFADVLRYPFARITMEEHAGVPTVRIEADFRAPSRLGDRLAFTLEVKRIGRTSVAVQIRAAVGAQTRMEVDLTLVWITPEGQAAVWPDPIRQRLTEFKEAEA
ncbi:acyl-CoA thioesterase (plasmid) [Gemmobacter fulvus]|uniref:Acyl-CoA thioesterase n=1 Tax=Gemmobacter fulvus TaxID=2840474 RepID=A0A975PA62_9RHOB|nr:thioesterase family protein [Gemmobacter fulvus]MBT9246307.1 acyl-CoA thioesterase [Gemmobacter fulvus]QWK92340.1 acyl-CoA thioesterase [Gemmobacter fulvus]